MAPKLYGITGSPPVRAVLMCAKKLSLQLDFNIVNVLTFDQLKKGYLQKNPQHTIPLLEEEDGFTLADSHAIMGYLVATYGKTDSLYPKSDNRLRARIDHLLHFDSSVLFIRGFNVVTAFLFRGVKPTNKSWAPLQKGYEILDKILDQNKGKYAIGDNLTIADFSLVTTLTSWGVLLPYDGLANVQRYVENVQKLPCYDANREGLETFKQIVEDTFKKFETTKK